MKILDRFLECANLKKTFKYYRFARSSYERLKEFEQYRDYWISLSSPQMTSATYLANDLIAGIRTKKSLIDEFTYLIEDCYDNEVINQQLVECFNWLVDSVLYTSIPNVNVNITKKHDFYIIPSGYGWSGSGAILDYLKEFNNTSLIMGEEKIIEGDVSFKFFCKNIHDQETIFKHCIYFFFINILGFYNIVNQSYYKPLCDARNRILKCKNIKDYANIVKNISLGLCRIIVLSKNPNHDFYLNFIETELINLSNFLLDLISVDVDSNKIPVLNNIVHTYNLDILRYLKNVKVVCSLRDPRSIYISKLQESVGFKSTPSNFVSSQREIRNTIKKIVKENGYNLQNCIFVNFEEFVLQNSVREKLIKDLGLNSDDHTMIRKYFNPDISANNVKNFLIFSEYKKDTDFIFENLKEFCVNDSVINF